MKNPKHEHHNHHEHHVHSHDSHDHHEGGHHDHHHGDFKKVFLISLPIGLIIMWISPLMGISIPFPFQYTTFKYADIVALIFSFILLFIGGKPFFQGGYQELKNKEPGMMALVSMGLGVSFIYSLYAVIMRYATSKAPMDFFFEFASLVLIMLLGHWIEMVALGKAGDAKASLAELLPKDVDVIQPDGSVTRISLSELKVGNIIQIQAGEGVAADGIIIKGESRVNESLLTGESKPILKSIGDTVIGGSVNELGLLTIEVTQTGKDSFLSQVQTLVDTALNQHSRSEDLAKKIAGSLFYIAVSAAIIATLVWWIIDGADKAIIMAVTTLVIACPHALGIAIPLVVSRSTSLGAKAGLLVKDRSVYNLTTKADIMILDKTGTLTTGLFEVIKIASFDKDYSNEQITELLAGIEQGSSHPIAKSIIDYANNLNLKFTKFDDIEVLVGSGIKGNIKKDEYQLISQSTFGKEVELENIAGATVSILTKNDQAIGAVYLGDSLKDSSVAFIKNIKSKGIRPIMATGDNEMSASAVANLLDIEYFANQSPADKYKLVETYKEEGNIVIMVGDGINDAPALVLADVGIAIGAGTQVAIDSANVILTNSEPGDIGAFIELSFKTNNKMNQNLAWGAGYNFLAIPIAAGILAPVGIILTPAVGAILMSLSTVIVALNAMTLNIKRKVK